MSNQGGTQSPPLQGRENDPMGQVSLDSSQHWNPDESALLTSETSMLVPPLHFQSAPGKSSQAIPDEQQRGGIFGSGENKGAESGQAGDSAGSGNLEQAVNNAKHAAQNQPGK
uniref:Uncharacterized protein n=1 Tax=Melanopsichium pennsylvanicum 4 TaxID=1398559 RepID=A0A077R0R1_9BASI|nr:putative protein [Melanopsichium pennsylvanicum 4]